MLDAMPLEEEGSQLTRKLLVTLMAEVTETINACPLTTVLSDMDEPQPLSLPMLQILKMQPLLHREILFLQICTHSIVEDESSASQSNSGLEGDDSMCRHYKREGGGMVQTSTLVM